MGIKNEFKKYNIIIDTEQEKKFNLFLKLFIEWNSKINISGIKEKDQIIEKHFIDSLLLTKNVSLKPESNILDLGSGGGFPAIPLAIFYKNIEITALDSIGKKTLIIEDFAKNLNLNLKTIHMRAEEAVKKYEKTFDIVLSRAVAKWPKLLKLALPFVKQNGYFIAYQGPAVYQDLQKHPQYEKKFQGKITNIYKHKLRTADRVLIEIQKNS